MCGMQVIRRDPSTGAPTLLFKVVVDRGISWQQASELVEAANAEAVAETSKKGLSAGEGWPSEIFKYGGFGSPDARSVITAQSFYCNVACPGTEEPNGARADSQLGASTSKPSALADDDDCIILDTDKPGTSAL